MWNIIAREGFRRGGRERKVLASGQKAAATEAEPLPPEMPKHTASAMDKYEQLRFQNVENKKAN